MYIHTFTDIRVNTYIYALSSSFSSSSLLSTLKIATRQKVGGILIKDLYIHVYRSDILTPGIECAVAWLLQTGQIDVGAIWFLSLSFFLSLSLSLLLSFLLFFVPLPFSLSLTHTLSLSFSLSLSLFPVVSHSVYHLSPGC